MMRLFTYTIFITVFSLHLFSANISKEEAKLVASNFLFGEETTVKEVTSFSNANETQIYVINFSPEGWALVASNDRVRPIIGYSPTGYFNVNDVDYNIKDWLNIQLEQTENAVENTIWASEWKQLEKGKLPVLKSTAAVSPLLSVTWNQSSGWNRFCPIDDDGPGGKAYIGCVAVAMAQAMHHIQYPERPTGEKSYVQSPYGTIYLNYDNEDPYEWSQMSLTSSDDYNAHLLYHCAVSVEMDFGSGGSGAFTTRVPFSLKKYFGFSSTVECIDRYDDDTEWIALLKSELNKGNVVIYAGDPGTGAAGHAFNIDGYSASGYFHFNWGWSGSYNGYFSINDVAPGSYDFTSGQQAVIGIQAPYWGPTDIALSNKTVKANQPKGTVVGTVSVTDESEDDSFTFEVKGAPLFLEEGYADAKFYIEDMVLKTLEPLSTSAYPEVATIIVTDSEGLTYEESFEITIKQATAIKDINDETIKLYPNPVMDKLYIENTSQINRISVIDLSGKQVISLNYPDNEIDLSNLQKGIYLIQLETGNGDQVIRKIVKK